MTVPLHRLVPRALPFVDRLAEHGTRTALLTGTQALSYEELAGRVASTTRALGTTRRLVLLAATPDVDTIVTYLACLAAGHPVLLTSPDARSTRLLREAYDPDVVVTPGVGMESVREGSAHTLHPDLALLLSTSGSTGSPKLVRLSHDNLQSNAEAIAASLGIRSGDRAITSLPLHYCYGLSVLHSHLASGAATVLTGLSVTEPCFWQLFRDQGVTTLPGVPHTFALLDRVGFAELDLPQLRYLTQAGGRLAPEQVRRFAELGQRRGWDLVVMYGQTEATARMAYLPPDLAASRPGAIGVPVPGGTLRLEPVGDGTDELVYSGPNVMLGYATTRDDLAQGRTVHELRTGDLARQGDDGLFEVVGRRSRFLKVLGLRIDLDQVETQLADAAPAVACLGTDAELVVAVEGGVDSGRLRRRTVELTGLPLAAVRVCPVQRLPRTAAGKVDGPALQRLTAPSEELMRPGDVRAAFAQVLERDDVTDGSSFVSLGGDSLSYVEASLRLEDLLGHLPAGWHLLPVVELEARRHGRRRRGRAVETGVVLRAVAIVLIVAHHAHVFRLLGGAHLLLGVAGFNFARFQLTSAPRSERLVGIARSTARLVVPALAMVALGTLLTDHYGLVHLLLVHDLVAPFEGYKDFWFVEVLAQTIVVCGALLALPSLDRLERRAPFLLPGALLAVGLLARFDVLPAGTGKARLYAPYAIFWLFVWGWAAARATEPWQRLLLSGVLLASLPGFFLGNAAREVLVGGALLLLLWVPTLRLSRRVLPTVGVLASSSLYVYLSHYLVVRPLAHWPVAAMAASFAVGLLYWQLATRVEHALVVRRQVPSTAQPRRAKASFQTGS